MDSKEMVGLIARDLGLTFDMESGVNTVLINDQYEITFIDQEGAVVVMGDVAPATGNFELDYELMKRNFLGLNTGGNTLGIDSRDNEYVLSMILFPGISYETLRIRMERFIDAMKTSRQFIEDFQKNPDSKSESGLSMESHGFVRA